MGLILYRAQSAALLSRRWSRWTVPKPAGLPSRHMEMGVTVSQNGILSHEGLRSEEGAQDRRSDEHHCADSTQAERKIFYSFVVHISVLIDALEGGTLRATPVSAGTDWQAAEKPGAGRPAE